MEKSLTLVARGNTHHGGKPTLPPQKKALNHKGGNPPKKTAPDTTELGLAGNTNLAGGGETNLAGGGNKNGGN